MKNKISITLDEEAIKKLDITRGLIPRSTFINALLKKGITMDYEHSLLKK